MMEHTPEPWKTEPTKTYVFANNGKGHDGVICKMANNKDPLQWACKDSTSLENTANAYLIATAPELLDKGYNLAMLGLQSERYKHDLDFRDAVDNFLEVYRKAKGE